jgi:ATP-dependent exoDNAse (exonuclease V) beta subunit
MHWNIEHYLNDVAIAPRIPEFQQFLQFHADVIQARKIRPYRTEWRIAAPDLSLGGSVDFVGRREDGSYVLMDWKRSKNLPVKMYKSFGRYAR